MIAQRRIQNHTACMHYFQHLLRIFMHNSPMKEIQKPVRQMKLLVVDDERNIVELIRKYSLFFDFIETEGFSNPAEAIDWAKGNGFDIAIVDYKMPAMHGLALIKRLKERHPDAHYVIMTGYGEMELAVDAIRAGVSDFMHKPVEPEDFRLMVDRIIKLVDLKNRNRIFQKIIRAKEQFIGESPEMLAVKKKMKLAALSDSPVLITGETGVGKEMVAKALHLDGKRKSFPFIAVNCASFVPALLESELFGHEKGSFTGADQRHIGKLESAGNGTVFLDEIGEIPPNAQVKLLRVLQEKEIERIGGNQKITLNSRILAATNRNLAEDMASGAFRKDLYYRLNTIHLHIPPLRERREDIMLLVSVFLLKFCAVYEKNNLSFTPAVEEALRSYEWPGNVRQLENVIDYAVMSCNTTAIDMENLPADLTQNNQTLPSSSSRPPDANADSGLPSIIAVLEREKIETALKNCRGNKSRAALALGLTRAQLLYKLKKYGLE